MTASYRQSQTGARIKHWYGNNFANAYDRAYAAVGSTLRAEMTMQDPELSKSTAGRKEGRRNPNDGIVCARE